jgi:hypothetical protein
MASPSASTAASTRPCATSSAGSGSATGQPEHDLRRRRGAAFGGEGLSGTGPKAGGPRYLHRFATERTVSIDTTAACGDASLLSLGEEISPTRKPPSNRPDQRRSKPFRSAADRLISDGVAS